MEIFCGCNFTLNIRISIELYDKANVHGEFFMNCSLSTKYAKYVFLPHNISRYMVFLIVAYSFRRCVLVSIVCRQFLVFLL